MAMTSIFEDVKTWGSSHVSNRSLLEKILVTDDSSSLLVARLALALVIFPHGAQKALGWFGGFGFWPTLGFFGQLGIPVWLAALAIASEFLGAIFLFFGLFTRIAAFGILCNMLVAVLMIHKQFGFFMNWSGAQSGEGIEFHLLAMALASLILVGGAGRNSIDRELYRKTRGV